MLAVSAPNTEALEELARRTLEDGDGRTFMLSWRMVAMARAEDVLTLAARLSAAEDALAKTKMQRDQAVNALDWLKAHGWFDEFPGLAHVAQAHERLLAGLAASSGGDNE